MRDSGDARWQRSRSVVQRSDNICERPRKYLVECQLDIFSLVIQEGHGWRDAELPENLIAIVVVPYLGNLAVNDAEPAGAVHQDVLSRGTNKPVTFAGMSAF